MRYRLAALTLLALTVGCNPSPQPDFELPSLKTGWREEVVGDLLEKLLLGRVSLRIVDPLSDRPLSFSEE